MDQPTHKLFKVEKQSLQYLTYYVIAKDIKDANGASYDLDSYGWGKPDDYRKTLEISEVTKITSDDWILIPFEDKYGEWFRDCYYGDDEVELKAKELCGIKLSDLYGNATQEEKEADIEKRIDRLKTELSAARRELRKLKSNNQKPKTTKQ